MASGFGRRRGESAADWLARLTAVDASALDPDDVDELTLRLVQAGGAARRSRVREPSAALRRCQDSVRILSPQDRRLLARWLRDGMPD